MIRSTTTFWSLMFRVEEWFFIARFNVNLLLLELSGMEEEYQELKTAFADFLAKDKEDDATAVLVAEKQAGVDTAIDELDAVQLAKTQTADAKATARARVEELMDATN